MWRFFAGKNIIEFQLSNKLKNMEISEWNLQYRRSDLFQKFNKQALQGQQIFNNNNSAYCIAIFCWWEWEKNFKTFYITKFFSSHTFFRKSSNLIEIQIDILMNCLLYYFDLEPNSTHNDEAIKKFWVCGFHRQSI